VRTAASLLVCKAAPKRSGHRILSKSLLS
jgi:hypothetical protein